MTAIDPYLAVRAASIYFVVMATAAVWLWRRPDRRAVAGAALAVCWNLPVILALQLAAARFGWWRFDANGGLLYGLPVEMFFAWAWLWGAIPALGFPSTPVIVVAAAALGVDLILMPASAPVLVLGPHWLAADLLGIAVGLIPGQLIARWTTRDENLAGRAVLQVFAFSGLILFLLPAVIIQASGATWRNPFHDPPWFVSLVIQLLAIPAVVGLTAVQEFVTRGGGTPVPFDPPRQLVTSGVYAYVRNPMQLSAVVSLVLVGLVTRNVWIAAGGIMAHVYSVGLAGWDEEEDLRGRFGPAWGAYRDAVRRWIPRWRPWQAPESRPAELYVAGSCEMCSEVGEWFALRQAQALRIVAAENHCSGALTRITYEPGDGSRASTGVEAIARALEHVHFGWAMAGFALRLPGIGRVAQVLVDASGGHARAIRSEVGKLEV